jgi:cysteine synthase
MTPLQGLDSHVAGIHIGMKLEGHNPTGSIKDRLVSHLLSVAAADGDLLPRSRVVEVSTGNSGVALARAASILGHVCEVLLPSSADERLVRRIADYGAVPTLLPISLGPQYAFELARRRAAEGWFWPNQFTNPHVPAAYVGLAQEILHQCPEIDCFVAGIGTGGTLHGVGSILFARRGVHVVAVEPEEEEVIEGLRNTSRGTLPNDVYPRGFAHETLYVSRSAAEHGRRLLGLQGLSSGLSSGAVYEAAMRLAQRRCWRHIVVISADGTRLRQEEEAAS